MRIDLNADVGESYGSYRIGEDAKLFDFITSANIACGFHAGDFNIMRETVEMAAMKNVSIGAHPGYPDLQGFGRRAIQMSPREIYNAVVYQIGALKQFCDIQGVPVSHVKPHGALYNTAAIDKTIAEAIAEAVYDSVPTAYLYGLCQSELVVAGNKIGLQVAGEAFADRRYTASAHLCSRLLPNAVIDTYQEIEKQITDIIVHKQVQAITGEIIEINADTICFHGDGVGVAEHAKMIRRVLKSASIQVASPGEKR